MKEYPILFAGSMVNAILEGRKTQTRRVVKPIPLLGRPSGWCAAAKAQEPGWVHIVGDYRRFCPYGQPGDRLWVRETHWRYGQYVKAINEDGKQVWKFEAHNNQVRFEPQPKTSDRIICGWHRRPSIFMPTGSERISLKVVNARVERVQDISEEDAMAEGCEPHIPSMIDGKMYRRPFNILWDSINAERGYGWDKNPWVWVVEFRRVKP